MFCFQYLLSYRYELQKRDEFIRLYLHRSGMPPQRDMLRVRGIPQGKRAAARLFLQQGRRKNLRPQH